MSDARGRLLIAAAAMAVLAVGIVLGSGPLRSALLGATGDRIDALQSEVESVRLEAAEAHARADAAMAFIDGTAPATLGGVLPGTGVLVVELPGAPADAAGLVDQRIVLAGGVVAGRVALGEGWSDPDSGPFRSALAAQVAPSLVGVTANDEATVLAHAFVQGATGGAPSGSDFADVDAAGTDRGAVLWDLLEQAGLAAGERGQDIEAVILVGPRAADAALVAAFAGYDAPVTAAGSADAVAAFRAGDTVATVEVDDWVQGSVVVVATAAETLVGARVDYSAGAVPGILGVSAAARTSDG